VKGKLYSTLPEFRFTADIEGTDWAAFKAMLKADSFDNGRSEAQYGQSARNSFMNVFVFDGERVIGNGRALSDGVCNAYIVDVWTHSAYRRRGIGSEIVRLLTEACPGQHVYLFTDDAPEFYEACGFERQGFGMGKVVGDWLVSGESLNL